MKKIFKLVVLFLLGIGLALSRGGYVFASSSWQVPGDHSGVCTIANPSCATIQAAINGASGGDTIHVAAGIYSEQISINKSLTLVGAGASMTTLQAPSLLVNDPDGSKTVALFTGAITAEISGFTIQGPVNGLSFGIYVRGGATVNIHDNVVKDIRDEPLSGGQNDNAAIQVGRYPYGTANQIGVATITNNKISGYQKVGIAVENTGSAATITGNTVTGIGPTTITSQNGIQLRRGATGSIKNNIVTGNAYDGPTYSAFGIGVTYPGFGVVVQGNTVNHNSANIYGWESDGIQILDNKVSDTATVDQNKVAGITIQGGTSATASVGLTGIVISGNSVKNNLSGPSTQSDGVDLYGIRSGTVSNNVIKGSSYDGILIGGSGNIAITGNRFSGNGLLTADPDAAAIDFRGIPSRDWSQPLGNGGPNPLEGFTVHENSFLGDRNGILNYDSGGVDAIHNWWGDASGPNDSISADGSVPDTNSGTGLSAKGSLDYSGWCVADCATAVDPSPAPTPSSSSSRQAIITVVKTVINDNGGTKTVADFPLFINGTPVVSGVGNSYRVPGDAFWVTETPDPNYVQTFSGDCDSNGSMSLSEGGDYFCIVTNDDIGTHSAASDAFPYIDVVKVPSPLSLPGGSGVVKYTYTLRNIGTVPVTDITMVGDTCSPIVLASGDTNFDSKLDVDEAWKYTCTQTLTETHTNTVTATGWANNTSAVAIASATVVVGAPTVPPLIHVTPLIQVSNVPRPTSLLSGGGLVTYFEKVTNPGNVPLSNVQVINDTDDADPTDEINETIDKCANVRYLYGDTNHDSKLDPSETWTYICRANLMQTTTNTVMVSGEANGMKARDLAVVEVPVAASRLGQKFQTIAAGFGIGSRGTNVKILQQFLILQNTGPATRALAKAGATAYFGVLTRASLAEFQVKVGIRPALGYFNSITRAYLNTHY